MPELDFDEMLASLAAAASDDPTDHMPMTCRECGERCGNRMESWLHTHSTGHRQFTSTPDAHEQLPCVCCSCGHRCLNRSAAVEHGKTTGHHQFRVQGRHCEHCAGFAAACSCSQGCPRPPGAECEARSRGSSSNHCEHCAGRLGACACSECPRKPSSLCFDMRGAMGAKGEGRHSGHRFDGDQCGVCRECGRCTYRITGRTSCINDRGRGPRERPPICGCGSGPSVCSRCGVGPCCRARRCQPPEAPVLRPSPVPPAPRPVLRRENSSRQRGGNVPENQLDEDIELAQAIARSLEEALPAAPKPSPQPHQSGDRARREQEELDMAIALSHYRRPMGHPQPHQLHQLHQLHQQPQPHQLHRLHQLHQLLHLHRWPRQRHHLHQLQLQLSR
ncbi:unnamed protein product [Durusdinium trenchii]|uniref:C2H2-type domain-containing protein n=1 Tax=Durusdinium trenchii TaxID=1381693 RepID=A0ABP0PQQ0_9DINO